MGCDIPLNNTAHLMPVRLLLYVEKSFRQLTNLSFEIASWVMEFVESSKQMIELLIQGQNAITRFHQML